MKKTCLCLFLLLLLLSGCGRKEEPKESKPEVETEIAMEALEDGAFYVRRAGHYEKLYANYASYNIKSSAVPDTSHTLWFTDDFDCVPTMYEGEELVYKSGAALSETFFLERFQYVGYTVGIAGLSETASGRYRLDARSGNALICPVSDAASVLSLDADSVILDKIGGIELRKGHGMLSEGGCILGLKKGLVYRAELYVGTYLFDFNLTADTIALTSSAVTKTIDYTFLQSRLLRLELPAGLKTGYYLVNGYGLVRYVAGTGFDETTDFNEPNDFETETASSSAPENDERIEKTYVNEGASGTFRISLAYEKTDLTLPPLAYLLIDGVTYELSKAGDDCLSAEVYLKSEERAKLVITELKGRQTEVSWLLLEE